MWQYRARARAVENHVIIMVAKSPYIEGLYTYNLINHCICRNDNGSLENSSL